MFPQLPHPHTHTRPFILSGLAHTSHPIFQCFPLPIIVTSLILSSPTKILLEHQALEKLTFLPKSAVPPWGSLSHLPNPFLASPHTASLTLHPCAGAQGPPAPRIMPVRLSRTQPCGPGGPWARGLFLQQSSSCAEQWWSMRKEHSSACPAALQHTHGPVRVAGFGSFASNRLIVYVIPFLLLWQSLFSPREKKQTRETRKWGQKKIKSRWNYC